MKEILGTPSLAKCAANYMARTELCGELGRACLAPTEQNPQQVLDLILASDHSLPPAHPFSTEYEPPVHSLPSSSFSLSASCT